MFAVDEVLDYFKSHPQNRDHRSLPRSVPLAGVAEGESIDAGVEAPLKYDCFARLSRRRSAST